jgi:hypothetical protein
MAGDSRIGVMSQNGVVDMYCYREWISYAHCARVEMLNKFLSATYSLEFSWPALYTIICLTIRGVHSHVHINSLVLHEARAQRTLTCAFIYKLLARFLGSADLHVAI